MAEPRVHFNAGPLGDWCSHVLAEARDSSFPSYRLARGGLRPAGVGALEVLEECEALSASSRSEPWRSPLAADYAQFHVDGERERYERLLFTRDHRLDIATLAASVNADQAAIDEVLNGVMLLVEQSSWCWPAHDDAYVRRGWYLPDPEHPYLDLGASEEGARLAWVDALVGEALERSFPGIRARMTYEVHSRVIRPFLERDDWWWLGVGGRVNNWLPWICGNVLTAVIQFGESEDVRMDVLGRVLAGLDRYFSALGGDGAIDEGFSYWWEGPCRALEAVDLVEVSSGLELDDRARGHLRGAAEFPSSLWLGSRYVVSHSDAVAVLDSDRIGYPWHVLFRWSRRLTVRGSESFALSQRERGVIGLGTKPPHSSLGRIVAALMDSAWVVGGEAGLSPGGCRWWPSVQLLVARDEHAAGSGLTLGVKGGSNGESHNHLDVGSISVAAGGVPAVIDLGRGVYSSDTFSKRRYEQWHIASEWHSVPRPSGCGQGIGVASAATVLGVNDDASGVEFELRDAYPVGACTSWIREARLISSPLDEGGLSQIRVVDSWKGAPGSSVTWVLAGEVVLCDGCVLVTLMGRQSQLRVSWHSERNVEARLERRKLEDPYLREAWGEQVWRLCLELDGEDGMLVTRITLSDQQGSDPFGSRRAELGRCRGSW